MSPNEQKKYVLIVDDDVEWHPKFKKYFEGRSCTEGCEYTFEVDTAASLHDAIRAIRERVGTKREYDVVIFDVRMETPEAGLQGACALALESAEMFPVIIIFTGFEEYEGCVTAMRHGIWDYIRKKSVVDKAGVVRTAPEIVVESAINRLREMDLRRVLRQAIGVEWYPTHSAELMKEHGGRIVALWHEPTVGVIASGTDAFDLEKNLREWRSDHAPWEQPFLLRVPRLPSADTIGSTTKAE